MGNGPEILLPTDTVPNNILDVSIHRITTFLDKRVNDMDNSIASDISLNQRCRVLDGNFLDQRVNDMDNPIAGNIGLYQRCRACRGEDCSSRSERDQCHL